VFNKNEGKKMKRIGIIIVLAVLALIACSRHNPLASNNDQDQEANTRFLLNASKYAEHQLKLPLSTSGTSGYVYKECMNNNKKRRTCVALYKEMLVYAKTKTNYKSLVLSDLTDQKVWQSLKSDYQTMYFNSID